MTYQPQQIEVIARVLVVVRGKILLCRLKGENWYFLPGGHVNTGEKTKEALAREINEELGIAPLPPLSFVGATENFYHEKGEEHHELNLVFKTEIPEVPAISKETHIEFSLVEFPFSTEIKLLPENVKEGIESWLQQSIPFWRDVK